MSLSLSCICAARSVLFYGRLNGLCSELLSGCGILSAWSKISILVLCGCSECLISSSRDQCALHQKWPIGVSVTSAQMATGMWRSWDKWSRFGTARPVLPLLGVSIQKHTDLHRCHFHFVAYLLPEHLFSMLGKNGLCGELLSSLGVLVPWVRISILVLCGCLHAWFHLPGLSLHCRVIY